MNIQNRFTNYIYKYIQYKNVKYFKLYNVKDYKHELTQPRNTHTTFINNKCNA